jgi:hypothetical protein
VCCNSDTIDSYQTTGTATVDFLGERLADPDVGKALTEVEIRETFDLVYHLRHPHRRGCPARC